MPVYITQSGSVMTARITGEIDHHSALWLRSDIDTAINDSSPTKLLLDFSAVTFMDSSGAGAGNQNHKTIGGLYGVSV